MKVAPVRIEIADELGHPTRAWVTWFDWVAKNMPSIGDERPTTGLFPGKQHFDTYLNKPIWVNSDATGWVDANGNPA